ncbi:MAPK protein [Acrasis kona]|uniref:MAPK protein n=1 Tax=Acrasis kona TaxID=1008807 RepID=A0AAW2Z1M4_9EUKA
MHSGTILSQEHIKFFMYQLFLGMSYLHSAGIVHRDLKPENILVNSDCDLKICDLGLSRGLNFKEHGDGTANMSTCYIQSRWYRAPELLLESKRVTKKIDVWSAGCIMAEMLGNGRVMFAGRGPIDQLQSIISKIGTPKKYPRFISANAASVLKQIVKKNPTDLSETFPDAEPLAVDLLKLLLKFDPDSRIDVYDALLHPYFSDLYDESHLMPHTDCFDFSYEAELWNHVVRSEDEMALQDDMFLKKACYRTLLNFEDSILDCNDQEGWEEQIPTVISRRKTEGMITDCLITQNRRSSISYT